MSPKNPLRDLTPTEGDLDHTNPSSSSSAPGEKLREKATKKLHGPDANPSQLGDPISLKAETSDTNPKPEEAGSAKSTPSTSTSPPAKSGNDKQGDETLREKAAKKLHGPEANPSQLGDPTSLKAETTDHVPTPGEEGASKDKTGKSRL